MALSTREMQLFNMFPTVGSIWKCYDGELFIHFDDAEEYAQTIQSSEMVEIIRPVNLPSANTTQIPVEAIEKKWGFLANLFEWQGEMVITAASFLPNPTEANHLWMYKIASTTLLTKVLSWGVIEGHTIEVGVGDYIFSYQGKWLKFFDAKRLKDLDASAQAAILAASNSATAAATSASAATSKAVAADVSATASAASAALSTTKATAASSSASAASASADTANTKATNANNSAGAAATSAATGTTKATEASNAATAAATSAVIATTKATEASNAATAAATSATAANTAATAIQSVSTIANISTVTARPVVAFAFASAKMIDPQYVFTRSSVATYIDKNGLMRVAQPNQPRFDHDVDFRCTGLLIEVRRTNILTFSTDISTWGRGPNVNYVGISSLLGYTAHTFSLTATGNAYVSKSITIVANKTYSYSYYSTSSIVNIVRMHRSDNSISRTLSNYTVTSLATGIYRHEITFTTLSDELIAIIHIGFIDVIGTFTVGMAQLEEGDFSTSYIPTAASSVTRQADFLNITSTAFIKSLGSIKEGAVFLDIKYKGSVESSICEFRGADTAGWNVVRLMVNSNYIRTDTITGGVTFATISSGVINTNIQNKVNVNFGTNLSKMHINAVNIGSDNTVDMPNNIDSLKIFSSGILSIKTMLIFKTPLTDTESIAITTPQNNTYPSALDFSGMAFVTPEAILRRTGKQEFSIDGIGSSITRNIRRSYDFSFEIVDSSGVTITSQPAAACLANTDNTLIFTAPAGKTVTYAIVPYFEY